MNLELIEHLSKQKGSNPSILFIHGMWHGAWCWENHFMPYFSEQGYNTYALSLRGHGGSEGQANLRWHSISDYVKDVEWAVSKIGKPTIIVGHSMGGFVTQKFLETNAAVAAVLLASVPPSTIWAATFRVLAKHPMAVIKSVFTLNLYHVIETLELTQFALFSKNMPLDIVKKYHAKMTSESFRAYLDMLGLCFLRPKKVKTPVLVISEKNVLSTAKAYGTDAILVPGVAHDVMLDEKWMLVADWLLNWLKEKKY